MKEIEFKFSDTLIKTIIFEKMLVDLGISKREYCELREKSVSWFHNTLRKRGHLNHKDIKALFSDKSGVSISEFIDLCDKYGVILDPEVVAEAKENDM